MASLTATPDPTTGVIRIDIEQSTVRDTFTRVVAGGWGNATPTAQAWTATGGAAGDYSVNGTQGLMTFATTNVPRVTSVASVVGADMGAMVQCTIAVLALTQPIQVCLVTRHTDANNYYFAELSLNPVNPPTLLIRKNVLGVTTTLSTSLALAQNHAAGATWLMSMEVCGTEIKAKAWRSTVTEPDWMVTVNDSNLVTGVNSGCRSVLATGNTNGATVFAFDNFCTWVSQPFRLFRVTPDGVSTEVRGSPGFTEEASAAAATATATFYDNEAPFDTRLLYTLTSNCSTTVEATSGPATLLSRDNGWIRDPEDASKNILLTFGIRAFDDCTSDLEVALVEWQPRIRANASGVFPIVNNPRPNTVSMKRKRYASGFILASKTLTDVDMIDDILAPGTILLVSLPASFGFGRPYNTDYVTIGDVTEAQINTDDYRDANRAWEIPFELSNAPVDLNEGGTGGNGIGSPGATYDDLAASALGTTYNTLTASGETFQQVAQGVGY